MEKWIEAFKNREVKAKEIFNIYSIGKIEAYDFVRKYHYLGDAKFFSMFAYGLFHNGELVGAATYALPQGVYSMKGWFSAENNDRSILELTRLCLLPDLNGTNAASYLLGGSIRLLKKENVRAIVTLATSDRHVGSIYQICNFKYYGLTNPKSEFWNYKTQSIIRCKPRLLQGVWINKPRKHRYAYIIDKTLKCNYEEQPRPASDMNIPFSCCGGTKIVHDNRFNVDYTCPICTGHLYMIKDGKEIPPTFMEMKSAVIDKQLNQQIANENYKLEDDAF